MRKPKPLKRVCFDIETELFSEAFRIADNTKSRLKHAPKMRVACAFDGVRWMYFLPSEAPELIKLLLAADEVISFNGKVFDELVLRKHHKMVGEMPIKGKHIDLLAEIFESERQRVSLHRLVERNFGEKKHTKGRRMANLDIEALKEACRSDVWQTYRLWELWSGGSLRMPERRIKEEEDPFDVGPGHHMPDICPRCHAVNTLILIEYDMDEMSEGQAADYEAGVSGTTFCDACEFEFDWGF
ncbi:MAG: ribonuclease H-like domain-containing protein [Methylococcales bacterium]